MSHDRTITETETAPAGDEGAAWAWATEYGAPEWASTEQLLSWLARGELPPHALVWKPGWGEWLPAMQVAELASAFPRVTPGSRRVARSAAELELAPPPVPVAHYPRLRLLAKDVLAESPAAPAVSQGLVPAEVGRRVLRDLDHVQQDVVTSQVPAAAMLEAALAMKRLGAPVKPSSWGQLQLGSFGDAQPPSSTPEPRTLSSLAVELSVPEVVEREPSAKPSRRSSGYGRWLLFGVVAGSVLGLLSVRAPSLEAAAATAIEALKPALPPEATPEAAPPAPPPPIEPTPPALPSAPELARVAPAPAKKAAGLVLQKRNGAPAVLRALRVSENPAFDRVVFEFREGVPGYRLAYVDKPVRDCGSGTVKRIDGDSWLEVRFSPAFAHTEGGEATVRARELKPALSVIRELERTCDFEGVVTWVVGTASARHFRAFELSSPPRLIVDIDH